LAHPVILFVFYFGLRTAFMATMAAADLFSATANAANLSGEKYAKCNHVVAELAVWVT
jgi:hypothetical protein